jgi:hypothetical protein
VNGLLRAGPFGLARLAATSGRLVRFVVVSVSTGQPAHPLRCVRERWHKNVMCKAGAPEESEAG